MEYDEDPEQKAWREKMEMDLYYAIERNDPETLQTILDAGYDPNLVFDGLDPMGRPLCWYPLHFCCEKGRDDCARALIKAGADLDVGDRWCMTPLMYAIQREWHNMVELMIECGATIDLQDSKGRTPLHLAVECSYTNCIQMLVRADALINVADLIGRTPLWNAVTKDGRVSHVQAILDKSIVNLPDKRDKRTPLQEAIVYADVDRLKYVRLLLDAGSEVNHRDEANLNSMLNLLYVSRRNRKGVTKDELAIANALIDAGYKLNDIPPRTRWHKFGGTAIKMAAEQGATELVELFLSRGADPDLADDCRVTPLLTAAFNNRFDCVVALLNANCKLDVFGELKIKHLYCEVTPLQCAIIKGHLDIARLLVLAGASTGTERYLFDGDNVPEPLINDCDFWLWLIDRATNPLTMFELCLRRIRQSVGFSPKGVKLDALPLPTCLKRCILLEELLQVATESD